MNEEEIENTAYDLDGRVSKIDKWKYNDTLNILARNALFLKGTPRFGYWVSRFVTALKPINTDKLPLRQILVDAEYHLSEKYYWIKIDQLRKNYEIWYDDFKRDHYLSIWEEEYWEKLFDYALELATRAGFTIYLVKYEHKIGGGGVGFDTQIPVEEL
jgi:hypothetical protein